MPIRTCMASARNRKRRTAPSRSCQRTASQARMRSPPSASSRASTCRRALPRCSGPRTSERWWRARLKRSACSSSLSTHRWTSGSGTQCWCWMLWRRANGLDAFAGFPGTAPPKSSCWTEARNRTMCVPFKLSTTGRARKATAKVARARLTRRMTRAPRRARKKRMMTSTIAARTRCPRSTATAKSGRKHSRSWSPKRKAWVERRSLPAWKLRMLRFPMPQAVKRRKATRHRLRPQHRRLRSFPSTSAMTTSSR
mmetsp:Transcript_7901/g.22751  ORF Transcript_7901/g.22751 Transcript_7901/m.22751 type:complete len:254 (+) Transcript_7901:452-1213(+)